MPAHVNDRAKLTEPKLLGIFGTGRNGSTLLCRLLDGIPDCYTHPVDLTVMAPFNDLATINIVRKRSHNNTTNCRLRGLKATLPAAKLWRYFRMQQSEIEAEYVSNTQESIRLGIALNIAFLSRMPMTIREFLPAFLSDASRWVSPELWAKSEPHQLIFKSTETAYMADYQREFPDMSFLHIVRNPFDTWSSFKRTLMVSRGRPMHYLGGDTLKSFLEYRWIPHVDFITHHLGDPRHMVVRYEDLVQNPYNVISSVCRHFSLSMPGDPDAQTILNGRHFQKAQPNPSQKDVLAPERPTANLAQIHGYDEVITEREKNLIRFRTGCLGAPFGYFIDTPHLDYEALLKEWDVADEWDRRNLHGLKDNLLSSMCRWQRKSYVRNIRPAS